ncbi:MAG: hypothetical protein HC942_22515 [Microcoleus sp. SU_5_6]|nr:hypothetical protein [Microcoleus sp. SU_5_6]
MTVDSCLGFSVVNTVRLLSTKQRSRMAELTLTLKLPFYRLNQAKVLEFERLTAVNTQVANELLTVDKKERIRRGPES